MAQPMPAWTVGIAPDFVHQPSSVLRFNAPLPRPSFRWFRWPRAARCGVFSQNVHSLHQVAGHGHVVIFRNTRRRPRSGWRARLTICWIKLLALRVPGVRFPGKNKLHGRAGSVSRRFQPVQIRAAGAWRACKWRAPGKADGQGVGIEHLVGRLDFGLGRPRGRAGCGRGGAPGHQPLPRRSWVRHSSSAGTWWNPVQTSLFEGSVPPARPRYRS